VTRLSVKPAAVVVLLLVGLGVAVLVSALVPRGGNTEVVASATPAPGATIYVHVLGAVLAPGLYELREGDRVVDAIAVAGGFADGADQTQLNLARVVGDGEQLVVPVMGAVLLPGEQSGKVNLNTATAEQLETLPRVGPALAQRILDWREANGRFSAIDDLLGVTGIGAKTFEGLRELVTV
jgi:competence protein ComEA